MQSTTNEVDDLLGFVDDDEVDMSNNSNSNTNTNTNAALLNLSTPAPQNQPHFFPQTTTTQTPHPPQPLEPAGPPLLFKTLCDSSFTSRVVSCSLIPGINHIITVRANTLEVGVVDEDGTVTFGADPVSVFGVVCDIAVLPKWGWRAQCDLVAVVCDSGMLCIFSALNTAETDTGSRSACTLCIHQTLRVAKPGLDWRQPSQLIRVCEDVPLVAVGSLGGHVLLYSAYNSLSSSQNTGNKLRRRPAPCQPSLRVDGVIWDMAFVSTPQVPNTTTAANPLLVVAYVSSPLPAAGDSSQAPSSEHARFCVLLAEVTSSVVVEVCTLHMSSEVTQVVPLRNAPRQFLLVCCGEVVVVKLTQARSVLWQAVPLHSPTVDELAQPHASPGPRLSSTTPATPTTPTTPTASSPLVVGPSPVGARLAASRSLSARVVQAVPCNTGAFLCLASGVVVWTGLSSQAVAVGAKSDVLDLQVSVVGRDIVVAPTTAAAWVPTETEPGTGTPAIQGFLVFGGQAGEGAVFSVTQDAVTTQNGVDTVPVSMEQVCSLQCSAPVHDICASDCFREEQDHVFVARGSEPQGAVDVFISGFRAQILAKTEPLPSIVGIFSLHPSSGNTHTSILVVSFVTQTRVMMIEGEALSDISDLSGFETENCTIACAVVGDDVCVQVTSNFVHLVSAIDSQSGGIVHGKFDVGAGHVIVTMCSHENNIFLLLSDHRVVHLEISLADFSFVVRCELALECNCCSIAVIPAPRMEHAQAGAESHQNMSLVPRFVVAVGTYLGTVEFFVVEHGAASCCSLVLQTPGSSTNTDVLEPAASIPGSLCVLHNMHMLSSKGMPVVNSQLVAGLRDGGFLHIEVLVELGGVAAVVRQRRNLGTRPVSVSQPSSLASPSIAAVTSGAPEPRQRVAEALVIADMLWVVTFYFNAAVLPGQVAVEDANLGFVETVPVCTEGITQACCISSSGQHQSRRTVLVAEASLCVADIPLTFRLHNSMSRSRTLTTTQTPTAVAVHTTTGQLVVGTSCSRVHSSSPEEPVPAQIRLLDPQTGSRSCVFDLMSGESVTCISVMPGREEVIVVGTSLPAQRFQARAASDSEHSDDRADLPAHVVSGRLILLGVDTSTDGALSLRFLCGYFFPGSVACVETCPREGLLIVGVSKSLHVLEWINGTTAVVAVPAEPAAAAQATTATAAAPPALGVSLRYCSRAFVRNGVRSIRATVQGDTTKVIVGDSRDGALLFALVLTADEPAPLLRLLAYDNSARRTTDAQFLGDSTDCLVVADSQGNLCVLASTIDPADQSPQRAMKSVAIYHVGEVVVRLVRSKIHHRFQHAAPHAGRVLLGVTNSGGLVSVLPLATEESEALWRVQQVLGKQEMLTPPILPDDQTTETSLPQPLIGWLSQNHVMYRLQGHERCSLTNFAVFNAHESSALAVGTDAQQNAAAQGLLGLSVVVDVGQATAMDADPEVMRRLLDDIAAHTNDASAIARRKPSLVDGDLVFIFLRLGLHKRAAVAQQCGLDDFQLITLLHLVSARFC